MTKTGGKSSGYRSADLAYQEGTSDKVYRIVLEPQGGTFLVTATYGRNGGPYKTDVKYKGASAAQADAAFDSLLKQKTGKGYVVAGGSVGDAPASAAAEAIREKVEQSAWLPTDCTEDEALSFISSGDWVAQDKKDGKHVMVGADAQGEIFGLNRSGVKCGVPPAIVKALKGALAPKSLIDGEQMHDGRYFVYDVIRYNGDDCRQMPYETRFGAALAFVADLHKMARGVGAVEIVRSARWAEDKHDLIAAIKAEMGEGVVFKNLGAKYVAGRPNAGGSMRRLKFKKRLDVIVQRRTADDTKASFEMYALDETQKPINLGSVTALTLDPDTGKPFYGRLEPLGTAVAEVECLYATPTMKLVQPVLIRIRTDKEPYDCGIGQVRAAVAGERFAGAGK